MALQSAYLGQTLPTGLNNWASEIDGMPRVHYPVDCKVRNVNVGRTQVPFVRKQARRLDSGRQTSSAAKEVKFISNSVMEVGAGVGLAA